MNLPLQVQFHAHPRVHGLHLNFEHLLRRQIGTETKLHRNDEKITNNK